MSLGAEETPVSEATNKGTFHPGTIVYEIDGGERYVAKASMRSLLGEEMVIKVYCERSNGTGEWIPEELLTAERPVRLINGYHEWAKTTAVYPLIGDNLVYPALKLAGEAGEVAEKVGKLMRDKGYTPGTDFFLARKDEDFDSAIQDKLNLGRDLALELGDVLWYVAAMATELGYSLAEIACMNRDKLESRKARGVLQGSGDHR
jgi:NTP pyrophosphatase (non-canonical NTP hydrolase)